MVEAPLHPCAIVLYAMRVLRAQSAGEELPPVPLEKDRAFVANVEQYAGTFYGAVPVFGTPATTRVLIVKGRLTLDGAAPLTVADDGGYDSAEGHVHFDMEAGGKMQRIWIDATPLYRVDLP